MQSYLDELKPDVNITSFKQKEYIIQKLRDRFMSYGYQQIQTPAFEPYDLYTTVTGTIHPDDMIKVMDPSGRVLVLRPDITIPITQKVASYVNHQSEELRYFYVLDVYRTTFNQQHDYEKTQAGIEFFGNETADSDAEVIALANQTLLDLKFKKFTIEIGHAAFFKEILEMVSISKEEKQLLKQFIQAKNIPGLEEFLHHLEIEESVKELIQEIPFLYGEPLKVIEKAKMLSLTKSMVEKLNRIKAIYETLSSYGYEEHVILDLGLINHMEYYSDVIFQGYIENIGKPILSGGRYDQLANQFHSSIPAIGFAFDVDLLVNQSPKQTDTLLNCTIQYNQSNKEKGIQTAQFLRKHNYSVTLSNEQQKVKSKYIIMLNKNSYTLSYQKDSYEVKSSNELLKIIQKLEGGN
ncbi:ATP phosphoribosyltransferase regulatory subunit [Ornithinibacillus halophilus]|uniref:ATP phosphoribosyltransferase regulatory subunit n=1 Tax=Ornithinibacillus halophilus TaxID=930117 RepID=A0A1M5H0C4_9BACI|nr:ATP phosphoribosyltransferase regulatory subunit [Ornithinibacillus halophilus]SHG09378.1 ATP phosphoribosyltransferase regulatory subunit [Ornithinibacillus halophilus]